MKLIFYNKNYVRMDIYISVKNRCQKIVSDEYLIDKIRYNKSSST